MKERPILFSGPMVRALLDGRKTQTRRVAKTFAPIEYNPHDDREYVLWHAGKTIARVPARNPHEESDLRMASPYGEPGDRLWVRETFGLVTGNGVRVVYRADAEQPPRVGYPDDPITDMKWTPSIYMRRQHSRITLAVTSVRVERVQAITCADAIAEGIDGPKSTDKAYGWDPTDTFRDLWDSINGKRPSCSWDANPFVWVVGFEVMR